MIIIKENFLLVYNQHKVLLFISFNSLLRITMPIYLTKLSKNDLIKSFKKPSTTICAINAYLIIIFL